MGYQYDSITKILGIFIFSIKNSWIEFLFKHAMKSCEKIYYNVLYITWFTHVSFKTPPVRKAYIKFLYAFKKSLNWHQITIFLCKIPSICYETERGVHKISSWCQYICYILFDTMISTHSANSSWQYVFLGHIKPLFGLYINHIFNRFW